MTQLYAYEFTLHYTNDDYKDVEVIASNKDEAEQKANYRYKEPGVTICLTNYYEI